MSPLSTVVSKILSQKTDFCGLCFNSTGNNAMNVEDEVVLNTNCNEITEKISSILSFVLGNDDPYDTETLFSLCETCTKLAIDSYKFIKMCKQNSKHLKNAVDTLMDCFENTTDDVSSFNSLFASINTKDFTSQQFYDNQQVVNCKSSAIARFKSISKGKQIKVKATEPKDKKRKSHKFSDETFEICDVIREKNQATKFKCKGCSNTFVKLFNFKKHYYSQHSPKVLKCSECPRSYGSEALLKQHKYDCHSTMVCSRCGKTYNNRYSLLYHVRQHTGEQPYACQFCDKKFKWSSQRAEHVRRFHKEPGVECDICHTKFRALGSLYDHRKRHFNPNSRLHIPQYVTEEEVT